MISASMIQLKALFVAPSLCNEGKLIDTEPELRNVPHRDNLPVCSISFRALNEVQYSLHGGTCLRYKETTATPDT
jgi:hypothetical protein